MSTTPAAPTTTDEALALPMVLSEVEAVEVTRLSPSFVRVVFAGDQLADMGFHLILYPLTGLFAAARAMAAIYAKLRAEGTTLGEADRLITFGEFNDLIGVEERYALSERFGGDSEM